MAVVGVHHPLEAEPQVVQVVRVVHHQEHRELVPPDAAQEVRGPEGLPERLRRVPEHRIPLVVPQGVVDPLEPVQVQEEAHQALVQPVRQEDPFLGVHHEAPAVQQSREVVRLGLLLETFPASAPSR